MHVQYYASRYSVKEQLMCRSKSHQLAEHCFTRSLTRVLLASSFISLGTIDPVLYICALKQN